MKVLVHGLLAVSLACGTAGLAWASCASDDPTGSMTAAARASTESTCAGQGMGCTTAPNHGAYVSCIAHAANDLAKGGTLPNSCRGAVKKCAARSACGKPGFVTCCITNPHNGTTRCKIKNGAAACSGTAGVCGSCCDACPAPGSGPTCP